jgi:lipopolysaccharide transport system ATP-binding protein
MSETAIKVENISKQYRLGYVGTGTFSHDINRLWHKMRGKEDPYLKVGETNDRTIKGASDYVWALKDIDFEVKKGEVLGIIGRNGAGKSTLLKILSRTTTPTTGKIKIKGRVASLLEVGTGFHPELSGRDNIFLNGAILGMTKKEIGKKFDEIVEFSGIERYIDTPVKRYSSGMFVRLAFAVAAHLDSEILIVDEVLAVGDAEFQKKCLGKMGEVSKGEGRTVLFVSHQLGMVRTLCSEGIVLSNGQVTYEGNSTSACEYYINSTVKKNREKVFNFPDQPDLVAQLLSCRLTDKDNDIRFKFDVFDEIFLNIAYVVRQPVAGMNICYGLDRNAELISYSFDTDFDEDRLKIRQPGIYYTRVKLPFPLKAGYYQISNLSIGIVNVGAFNVEKDLFSFEVVEQSFNPTFKSFSSNREGVIVCNNKWELISYKAQ